MKKINELRPCISAFLLMITMSLSSTGFSFFITPVCNELQVERGEFSLYFSFMLAAAFLTSAFLGKFMSRNGIRGVLLFSGVVMGMGLCAFSFAKDLWLFYLVSFLIGAFSSGFVSMCANIIVQKSYPSDRAPFYLGLVSAGSGVGGVLVGAVIPPIIASFGWRGGYRFVGAIWFLLVLLSVLILGKERKESRSATAAEAVGMTHKAALKDLRLYLLLVLMLFLSISNNGIQQHLAAILSDRGLSAASVSSMVSLLSLGMAVGKIAQGKLYAAIGPKKGGYLMIPVFLAACLLFAIPFPIYPVLLLLAFGLGVLLMLMPTTVRSIFGAKDYASIWSVFAAVSCLGGFVGSPLYGTLFDHFRSYSPALFTSSVLLFIGLFLHCAAFRTKKK